MRDNISGIQIRSTLGEFFETLDCTDDSWKDESCFQFKMNKHFIKTKKKSLLEDFYINEFFILTFRPIMEHLHETCITQLSR